MSRALFGDIANSLLAPCGTIEELQRRLYAAFSRDAVIDMPTTLKLRTTGTAPAIEIIEQGDSQQTIRITRHQTPDPIPQEIDISSSGVRTTYGDDASILTSSPLFAEDEPDADTEVIGRGNTHLDRFATAVSAAGVIVTVGGPGGPGGFGGFGLSVGYSGAIIMPFRLSAGLTAGAGNTATAVLQYWDTVAVAWAATAHTFTLRGDFIKTNRLDTEYVMGLLDTVSGRWYAIGG